MAGNFDVAVLSAEHGIRKPDPATADLPLMVSSRATIRECGVVLTSTVMLMTASAPLTA
jgi:hypothetical protein